MVLQKPGKTRKLQGRRLEREKKKTRRREKGRTPLRTQTPQDLGRYVYTTPDLLASPSTHHSLRILAQGNRYLFNRKANTNARLLRQQSPAYCRTLAGAASGPPFVSIVGVSPPPPTRSTVLPRHSVA